MKFYIIPAFSLALLQGVIAQPIRSMAPSWSPSGDRLAYYTNKDGNNEIYILDFATSEHTRITHNDRYDVLPKFSPEGTKLLFFSGEKGNRQIIIYDLEKNLENQVTEDGTNNEDPDWVTETIIIFNSDRTGNHELYKKDLKSGEIIQLTQNELRDFTPDVSSDGSQVVFVRGELGKVSSIYSMNINGTDQKRITTLDSDYTPTWVFGSEKIYFMSRCCDGANIYEWDLSANSYRQITTNPGNDLFPAGSPDGKYLAFSSNRDSGSYELYLMHLKSLEIERLTFNSGKN